MGARIGLIAIDVAVIVGLSIAIGAWAPHWPHAWLATDRFPLTLARRERAHHYRRLRAGVLAARLPELGHVFGGGSKRTLPGTDAASLDAYLVEVRRAEWVHVLSCLTPLPLLVFNPWWLWLAFQVAVLAVNAAFLLVLRHNRVRLTQIRRLRDR
ncbi:MAG: hypothetical protein PHU75_06980 [Candidatus Nanopelagicales bacterium]|nr:hypothetical protein [Candidatus Nanopelagicales bacterium]